MNNWSWFAIFSLGVFLLAFIIGIEAGVKVSKDDCQAAIEKAFIDGLTAKPEALPVDVGKGDAFWIRHADVAEDGTVSQVYVLRVDR